MNQKPYNKNLINFVCWICTGKYLSPEFFRTDLAPLSLGLYGNLGQILSRTSLTSTSTFIRDFKIYDGKPRRRRRSNKIILHTKQRE